MSKFKTSSKKTNTTRQYVQSPVVHDEGIKCPHCGERYGHHKAQRYPQGRQRMICGKCGLPFVVWRDEEK
ncbi:MAG: hypothetical protein PHH26_01640 [Candidatus Thermoplasmatota archaeon]|nr:hypothetical protein [Candidatus Thermoplasmatota archaeon]